MDPEDVVMKMYEAQAEVIMVRKELDQTKEELASVWNENVQLVKQKEGLRKKLLEFAQARDSGSVTHIIDRMIKRELELTNELERTIKEKDELQRRLTEETENKAGTSSDIQGTLAEIMRKLDDVSANNAKNCDEIKKKIDLSSRQQPKFVNQNPKFFPNNQRNEGNNRQNNWNQERQPKTPWPKTSEALLVFGGKGGSQEDGHTVYMLDYQNNLWNTFKLPGGKSTNCEAVVHLNGEIYFIDAINVSSRRELLGRSMYKIIHTYRNSLYKLASDFTWKNVSTIEVGHTGISKSTVVYENCIWIIGGAHKLEPTKDVGKYDPATGCWTEMPSLNYPRDGASAVVAGHKMYVCGGNDDDKKVECFDPVSQLWIIVCTLPAPRRYMAIAANGNSFILLGGGKKYPDTESYSHVSAQTGFPVRELPYSLQPVANGSLYTYPNHALNVADASVYTDVWKISLESGTAQCIGMPPLPEGRGRFSAICYGNAIVAIGGYHKPKPNKHNNNGAVKPTETVLIFNGKYWREGPSLPVPKADYQSVIVPLEIANKLVNKLG